MSRAKPRLAIPDRSQTPAVPAKAVLRSKTPWSNTVVNCPRQGSWSLRSHDRRRAPNVTGPSSQRGVAESQRDAAELRWRHPHAPKHCPSITSRVTTNSAVGQVKSVTGVSSSSECYLPLEAVDAIRKVQLSKSVGCNAQNQGGVVSFGNFTRPHSGDRSMASAANGDVF